MIASTFAHLALTEDGLKLLNLLFFLVVIYLIALVCKMLFNLFDGL